MPVHLSGIPCKIDQIKRICKNLFDFDRGRGTCFWWKIQK